MSHNLKKAVARSCAGCLVLGLAHNGITQTIDSLAARIRAARLSLPSVRGKLHVERASETGPGTDASRPYLKSQLPKGDYQWWIQGGDWQIVKRVDGDPGSKSRERIHVKKSYGDQILDYEVFLTYDGGVRPAYGKLFNRDLYHFVCPIFGRKTGLGYPEKLLTVIQSPEIRREGSAYDSPIEVYGKYGGRIRQDIHLRIEPAHGYLVTEFWLSMDNWRGGYKVSEVKQVNGGWFVTRATFGSHAKSDLTFSDIRPDLGPTIAEVPEFPPGSVVGGDDKLYRVGEDGKLHYWGIAGRKSPRASIAWGPVFVGSGALLLLGSLSWIFFRKRPLLS